MHMSNDRTGDWASELEAPAFKSQNSASALPRGTGQGPESFTNAFGARPFAERKSTGSYKQQFKRAYLTGKS
jgi:hypothetical protein